MDKISGLHDDLLVKILSFVPTKVAVSTCVLSKRWEFLWMWLPRLEYTSTKPELQDFIDKKLPLHRAPVIESLLLKLRHNSDIKPEDIKRWIDIAVSRYIRELEIGYYRQFENLFESILPSSLFSCKSLVILRLRYGVLVDVSSMVSLPSLKILQLENVKLVDEKSLQQLLSGCPGLEDLSVQLFGDDSLKEFTIIVPSLQSLSLSISGGVYEIDTPSLKYLKLVGWRYFEHYLIKSMPKLREAYVDVLFPDLKSLIGSITSVKRLTISFYKNVYGDGFVFNQLEHLKLSLFNKDSSNLLGRLLKVSPHLRVLDISVNKEHGYSNGRVCWNQPTSVHECLLSSLQIFNWSGYFGRPRDRDLALYILKNARHLKTATILADREERFAPKRKRTKVNMLKELTLSPRASSTWGIHPICHYLI